MTGRMPGNAPADKKPGAAAAEYKARQAGWRARLALSQKQFISLGNWRLGLGVGSAALAWLAFGPEWFSAWWLLAPAAVFIGLVIWHERVMRGRAFSERALRYYDFCLARLDDHWMGAGNAGERFRDGAHVYSEDLDVFGKGSLFELLCTARTAAGEDTLAAWLKQPATRAEALARQAAVREFREKLALREEVALLGEDANAGLHADSLAQWGARPPVPFAPFLRPLALVLAVCGTGLFLAFLAHWLPLWPFLLTAALDFLFAVGIRKQVAAVLGAVDLPGRDLSILALLIARLEEEPFTSPALLQLQAEFKVNGMPAARRIGRLKRWIELLDSSDHLLIRAIRPILLWREQVAMGIEAWRHETGARIGRWVSAVGRFEAISALASLAFERPEWNFPDLAENAAAVFEGQGLQHPLIAPGRCVANDVSLKAGIRLLIVSGSNMSGKSTLLRAIGLNTILAWAGAPAAAKQLRVSALQTGASIRVTDSLQDNRSRFFAEIMRLRQIVELTRGGRPVLFLLDELLSGTNSSDRRIGAAAVVRALLRGDSIGLLTTHDLALAEIEQDVGSLAVNVHFQDHMEAGQIIFDYQLRPGVVTHSNALELMRAIGLEID
jgi:MutS domain V